MASVCMDSVVMHDKCIHARLAVWMRQAAARLGGFFGGRQSQPRLVPGGADLEDLAVEAVVRTVGAHRGG